MPFDPIEADEPKGPKAPKPIGQLGPEPSTQTALEEPQGSNEEGLVGDTIIVDIGGLEDSN